MAPTKIEAAEAQKLLAAAEVAKNDLLSAAETARKMVIDTCEDAIRDLGRATQDRRHLNGSYR